MVDNWLIEKLRNLSILTLFFVEITIYVVSSDERVPIL